ncbi:MAG: PfkB family carbohydrate kinase [Candidatus Eisenbacteria bacterium]
MEIVVVGSVALDTIHTPHAVGRDLLGGSAAYFALAASTLASVGMVAVVGEDLPQEHIQLLSSRAIDLRGLERRPGPTFRWEGEYGANLKERRSLRTELGVFADFHPRLPEAYRDADVLFLANIHPELQIEVLAAATGARLVAIDTMDFWIRGSLEALRAVIRRTDLLLVNDEEATLLTGHDALPEAVAAIRAMGPQMVVVKKGPHGSMALGPWGWLALPALPVEDVRDPTGAGDSFAGGLLGYLAGRDWRDREVCATALAVATAMGSCAVEGVGVGALAVLTRAGLWERSHRLRELTRFDPPAE